MLEAILNRRSVRSFTDDPVSREDILEVLKAGFCAPSAHGASPWHVVVVKDDKTKERLGGIHKYSRVVARAPVALVVCVDRSIFEYFWIEDGSAFMENVLIQAAAMGLGTCWVGIRGVEQNGVNAENAVRDICGLPEQFGVVGMTPLGYPARSPAPHEGQLPEDRVHFDRYTASGEVTNGDIHG